MQSDLAAPKLTIVSTATKATLSLCCATSTLSIYNAGEFFFYWWKEVLPSLGSIGKLKVRVSFERVLWCTITSDDVLSLSLLRSHRRKLVLLSVSGTFDAVVRQEAERFSTFIMDKAYEGIKLLSFFFESGHVSQLDLFQTSSDSASSKCL